MTASTRRPASRKGAPAAALLSKHTPRSVDPDPLAGVSLPPLPTTPPPLPEGAVEGFDPPPPGATRAEEVPEDVIDLGHDGELVDPTTGKVAVAPGHTAAGKSESLAAELEAAEKIRQAEARADAAEAALEDLRSSTPMDVLGNLGPVNQVDPALHKAAQAHYRSQQQALRQASSVAVAEPEAPPEPQEDFHERRSRLLGEAKAEYERRVAAMPPEEPVYVVGPRPPRPKVAGHTLSIGDVVPGAYAFPRLESWVSTGILIKRER